MILQVGDSIEEGDEFLAINGKWVPSSCVGGRVEFQNDGLYRRGGPSLRVILDKQQEHVALVELNKRNRDRALALGQELVVLRKQFAEQHRDRIFVNENQIIETTNGLWSIRQGEVI